MRRFALILMLLAGGGIACGGLDYLHRCQHVRQAEQWAAGMRAAAERNGSVPGGPGPLPMGNRDDASCLICQILHVPVIAQSAPALVLALVFLRLAVRARAPARVRVRIAGNADPRGPPRL